MKHIIVTGGAGFIGSSLIETLLQNGDCRITCIDNLDPFYDINTKLDNLKPLLGNPNFRFAEVDIRDKKALEENLTDQYDCIVHLAAKAGVRPSIEQPFTYEEVNVKGTMNLLELAREKEIKQFVFASSSSVYGISPEIPWKEDIALMPVSPYASTKIAGEYLGFTYSHLYNIRFIALRFFTVYGPKQRPDLAIHKFTQLISEEREITLYGDGNTYRDYTYIDDTVSGIINAMRYTTGPLFEVFNLGNSQTVSLNELITEIEALTGKKARIRREPLHAADAPRTCANIDKAIAVLGYKPQTPLREGLQKFYDWYSKK